MEFPKDQQKYKLSHTVTLSQLIQETSLRHIDRELGSSNLGLFIYSMKGRKMESCDITVEQLHELKCIGAILGIFFQAPITLPSHREYDHHIPLVQGAKPPNIRPYHYGSLQKNEIEKEVQKLLAAGFIR